MTHAPVAAFGVATPSSLEGELRIDYPKLQFSHGTLPGIRNLQYAVDEGGVLRLRWGSVGGVHGDRVHIYIYCRGRGLCAEGRRGEGRAQLLLPDGFAEGELHVWAFAAAGDGRVSPTAYASAATPECSEYSENPEKLENPEGAEHSACSAKSIEICGVPIKIPPI